MYRLHKRFSALELERAYSEIEQLQVSRCSELYLRIMAGSLEGAWGGGPTGRRQRGANHHRDKEPWDPGRSSKLGALKFVGKFPEAYLNSTLVLSPETTSHNTLSF